MNLPDVPLDSWRTWFGSISGGLMVRFGWYTWRRLTGNPVTFWGAWVTRVFDLIAAATSLTETLATQWIEIQNLKADKRQLTEQNQLLRDMLKRGVEGQLSPDDLTAILAALTSQPTSATPRGSVSSFDLLAESMLPEKKPRVVKPRSRSIAPSTGPSPQNPRSDGSETS